MTASPEHLDTLKKGDDLRTAAKVIDKNYTQYHLTAEQLKDLQEWVIKQRDIYNEKYNFPKDESPSE